MVAWIYEFYFLVVKDNILPLENKIPISAPPCNIFYMFSANANAPRHARTFFLTLTRWNLFTTFHKLSWSAQGLDRKGFFFKFLFSLATKLCMVQFYLLPSSPGHTPGDLQLCSHLAVYSPPPGTQKETIPHPWDSSSITNMLFCVQNMTWLDLILLAPREA